MLAGLDRGLEAGGEKKKKSQWKALDFQREVIWKGRDTRDSGRRRNKGVRKRGHKTGSGAAGRRWRGPAGAKRGRAARRPAKREGAGHAPPGDGGDGGARRPAERARARGAHPGRRPQGRPHAAAHAGPRCCATRAPPRARVTSQSRPTGQPSPPPPGRRRGARSGWGLLGPGGAPHPPPEARLPPLPPRCSLLRIPGRGGRTGPSRRPLRSHRRRVPGPRLPVWAGTSREPAAASPRARCGPFPPPRELAFFTDSRLARAADALPPCGWAQVSELSAGTRRLAHPGCELLC